MTSARIEFELNLAKMLARRRCAVVSQTFQQQSELPILPLSGIVKR